MCNSVASSKGVNSFVASASCFQAYWGMENKRGKMLTYAN